MTSFPHFLGMYFVLHYQGTRGSVIMTHKNLFLPFDVLHFSSSFGLPPVDKLVHLESPDRFIAC